MSEIRERFLDVRGVRVRLLESGAGDPAFVFVHGLGSSATKWRGVLPYAGERGRAIALDLPGFGRSDAPAARYTVGWLAGAVRAVMDTAGIESAHVVGNSLGGLVGMWLARAWPDRVRSLVLVAPALPTVPGQRHERRVVVRFVAPLVPGLGELLLATRGWRYAPERIVEESLAVNCVRPSLVAPETVRLLCQESSERRDRRDLRRALLSAQRHLAWLMTGGRERVRAVAASLRVPVLLLWGEHDRMVPLAVGEHWLAQMPGAELVVLDGAGHNPQLEVPERVARAVAVFAERAERAAPIAAS